MTDIKFSPSTNFRQNPAWFRALNQVWSATYPLGTRLKLDKDDLIRAARKQTGLTDLGKDFSDEPLERLLKAVNEEACLHPVGRFITKQRFASLLGIRLRAEYFFKKFPEILDQELYPAWIIIGLQRTGTTKLQRLLAVDPDHRVIPSWEVINPMPLDLDLYKQSAPDSYRDGSRQSTVHSPQSTVGSRLPIAIGTAVNQLANSSVHQLSQVYPHPKDRRPAIARMSVNAVRYMSPGFFAVHPIDAMQPEEDILMLDVSFLSTTPEAMMNVPSYATWLEQTDQSPAYAYAVKMLKFLQWIRPAKRWILKTPHHLEFPDLIEKHFGEVRFLWPHRSLYESVPSFASMATYNRMMFSDRVDEKEVARHWVRKTGYMLDRALDYRIKEGNSGKFTDIWYKDLITDSGKVLAEIYRHNGGLDPAMLEEFRQHELAHPHRKHGEHQYSLADFDLAEGDIDRHTQRYQEVFKQLYER